MGEGTRLLGWRVVVALLCANLRPEEGGGGKGGSYGWARSHKKNRGG